MGADRWPWNLSISRQTMVLCIIVSRVIPKQDQGGKLSLRSHEASGRNARHFNSNATKWSRMVIRHLYISESRFRGREFVERFRTFRTYLLLLPYFALQKFKLDRNGTYILARRVSFTSHETWRILKKEICKSNTLNVNQLKDDAF